MRTSNGVANKRLYSENDTGTRPAAPLSPSDESANEMRQQSFKASAVRVEFKAAVLGELTRGGPPPDSQDLEDDGAAEIEDEFRRRLLALRRMRPHERAAALRAAREWRSLGLKALRDRRARDRRARAALWWRQQQSRKFG
jgi:hypothetical protein